MVKCWVLVTCLLLLAGSLGGCDTGVISTPVPTGGWGASGEVMDQNPEVYYPDGRRVVQPCRRVTGVVDAVRDEADGDKHILLHLDPPYQHLLQPANQNEQGD